MSWSIGRTLVVLAFVGVAVVAVILGPAKFIASFGFGLVGFPLLLTFTSGTHSGIPLLPGWLLAVSYVLPILWIVSLWIAGTRAWERNSTGGGVAFFMLAMLGLAVGLFLAGYGAGAGLRH